MVAAQTLDEAKAKVKQDDFFSQGLIAGDVMSHVDDKISVRWFDIDDTLVVNDQVAPQYYIALTPRPSAAFKNNKVVVTGYLLIAKILGIENKV